MTEADSSDLRLTGMTGWHIVKTDIIIIYHIRMMDSGETAAAAPKGKRNKLSGK